MLPRYSTIREATWLQLWTPLFVSASSRNKYTAPAVSPRLASSGLSYSELTGDGAGRLFAFGEGLDGGEFLAQVDPKNAIIRAEDALPGVQRGNGWAFAFYLFTAPSGSTVVNQFDPATHVITQVATLADVIVGAGVSPCAPLE